MGTFDFLYHFVLYCTYLTIVKFCQVLFSVLHCADLCEYSNNTELSLHFSELPNKTSVDVLYVILSTVI